MKKETLRRVRNFTKLIKKYPTWQEEKGEYRIYHNKTRSHRTCDGLYYFDMIPHIEYGKVKMVCPPLQSSSPTTARVVAGRVNIIEVMQKKEI